MSTKIYSAYRFPLNCAEEGIRVFHELLLEGALERYSTMLNKLSVESYNRCLENSEKLAQFGPKTEFKSINGKIHALWDLIVLGDNLTKRIFDEMTCGFNAWIYNNHMYVIPYGHYNVGNYIRKHETDLPDWIEEFGYWNNSDGPEWTDSDEGLARWKERGEIWEKVGPGGYNPGFEPGCLVHEVVDCSRYTGTGELEKLYRKRNNLKSPWS